MCENGCRVGGSGTVRLDPSDTSLPRQERELLGAHRIQLNKMALTAQIYRCLLFISFEVSLVKVSTIMDAAVL